MSHDPTFTIIRASGATEDLAREAIVELHGRALMDETAIADFLRDPTHYLLLALEGQRVIGSLVGYSLQHPHRCDPQFLLYEIDVRPERRNRGVGTALVERFIAQARAVGAFEVWVLTNESNRAATAMYSRCGLTRPNRDDVMLSSTLKGDQGDPQ